MTVSFLIRHLKKNACQETIKFDEGLKQTVDWFSVLAPAGLIFLKISRRRSIAKGLCGTPPLLVQINVPQSLE